MNDERCQRCCGNCRFAMPVEHQGEPLLVCPYRQECRGRLATVEPQEGCPAFRERVRPKEGSGQESCVIPLVNMDGLCALVDATDYEWLSRYTWRAMSSGGRTFYARTRCKGKWCFMHRMIMNPPAGMVVDHKNRYGLDNHRINLRNATRGQNNINRACDASVSGFRGVYPCGDKWGAKIGHHRRTLHIGVFDDPAEAARAYDRKAIELHGEFACLNFPEEAGGRIVCLSGMARVCPAAVARVRRMLYGSSQGGPLAPSACAGAIPLLHGACPCREEEEAEEEAAVPVFLRAGERHCGLLSGPAAQLYGFGLIRALDPTVAWASSPCIIGRMPMPQNLTRTDFSKSVLLHVGRLVFTRRWARGPPLWAWGNMQKPDGPESFRKRRRVANDAIVANALGRNYYCDPAKTVTPRGKNPGLGALLTLREHAFHVHEQGMATRRSHGAKSPDQDSHSTAIAISSAVVISVPRTNRHGRGIASRSGIAGGPGGGGAWGCAWA